MDVVSISNYSDSDISLVQGIIFLDDKENLREDKLIACNKNERKWNKRLTETGL